MHTGRHIQGESKTLASLGTTRGKPRQKHVGFEIGKQGGGGTAQPLTRVLITKLLIRGWDRCLSSVNCAVES